MSEYPSDWTRTTFGNVLNQRKEAGFTNEELLAVTSSLGIVKRDSLERRDTSNEDKSKYLLVDEGDIAYNTMRMWQGVSGVSRFKGIVSPAYTVCTPTEELDANFAGYLLKDPEMVSVFRQRSQGLVSDTWNLKYESFAQIPCSIPPLPEQKRIAEILSGIDERIKSLAKQKKKLESTYKAISSNIFSDISDRVPLGDVCDLQVGFPFRSTDFREEGIRLLRGENVGYGTPDWTKTQFLPLSLSGSSGQYCLEAGDIVVGMDRSFTKSGFKVSRISSRDLPCLLVQRVGRFMPKGITRNYLWHILQSVAYQTKLSASEKGMDIPHLSKSEILEPMIPLTGNDRQVQISGALDSLMKSIVAIKLSIEATTRLSAAVQSDLLSGRKRVSV